MLLLAGLLWGTGGVTGRALADATDLGAPAIAGYRLSLGGAVLVALLLARRCRIPRSAPGWRRIMSVAVLAATFQCTYFAAVQVATVSTATLIAIGSAPMFVVTVEALRARRWPSWHTGRPVLTGVAGLTALVGVPAAGTTLTASITGAALAASSGAAFAAFTLLGRRPLIGVDEPTVTGYGFLIGGAGLALVASPFLSLSFAPTPRSLALLLLLATVPTAAAYTFFFRGLRGATASTAAVVALLEPLTGTVLAVILFGDRLSVPGVVGAVLLLASVLDAGRSQLQRADNAVTGQPATHL